MQKVSDSPLSECRHCGGALHKVVSHSTFILKGSGWYATDYGKKDVGGHKTKPHAGSTVDVKKKDSSPAPDSTIPAAANTPSK